MPTDQERAADTVSEAERRVQEAATKAGGFLARALARTREEIEDVWAEARSVSRSRD
jgi:hypothetical protein